MCFAKRNNIVGMATKLTILSLHRQSNNLYLFFFFEYDLLRDL